jgi:hypothetical protein
MLVCKLFNKLGDAHSIEAVNTENMYIYTASQIDVCSKL